MFNQYVKDGKTINATEKAYNLLYKNRGYKLVSNEPFKEPVKDDKELGDLMGIESYTKAEIIEILSQNDIPHNPKDRKDKLYDLLIAGE